MTWCQSSIRMHVGQTCVTAGVFGVAAVVVVSLWKKLQLTLNINTAASSSGSGSSTVAKQLPEGRWEMVLVGTSPLISSHRLSSPLLVFQFLPRISYPLIFSRFLSSAIRVFLLVYSPLLSSRTCRYWSFYLCAQARM